MKTLGRAAILLVVMACLAGVAWTFLAPAARDTVISNSQVFSALATGAALVVAIVGLWPRAFRRGTEPPSVDQMQAAVAYLASETLQYWRTQAKDRRISTPSPASVRWSWASAEVAVPAQELQPDPPKVSGGLVLGESPSRLLTSGVVTELRVQLYERLDETRHRIVVLGGPGAGKTAAMLLLLIDILEHRPRESDQPVPVLLSLGGWNPQASSLRDWAAATLTRDYPGLSAPTHGGRNTAAELIRTGKIALFLDGLDEIPPDIQGAALTAIDRDAAGLKVVLTSRPNEYQAANIDGRLYGAAVIDVLPVCVQDATAFLLAEQLGQRRRAWQQVNDHLRDHPDSVAARTLTTPLALSLARDTYTDAGSNPVDLLDTNTHPDAGALLQHLLARSLTLAYPETTERAHATRWLSWIAQHMGSNRDLRWWDIPTWTPQWQLLPGFALVGAIVGALTVGLANGIANGLVAGLVFWVIDSYGWPTASQALAALWPARRERPHLVALWLVAVLVAGVVAGLPFVLVLMGGLRLASVIMPVPVLGLALTLGLVLAIGLVAGFIGGVVGGLMDRWSTPLATARAVGPLDVYRSDRRRALTSGLVGGLMAGLALWFVAGLVAGLAAGLTAGFVCGFGPILRLTVGQMTWFLRGQRVRFVPLLQTALRRQILRQSGAVYQFRHAALQDFLMTHDHTAERLSRE